MMAAAQASKHAADRRVGWCPGVLRPMRVGDGLLVRVKPRGQRLSFPQARAIAAAAQSFGNGALTLTARGNVQIRGVEDDTLDPLTAGLGDETLIDASPEGEAVRNVVSNPLAGADPAARLDLGAAVAALEQRLATDPALWRLPAKFAWRLDEGGSLSLDGVIADVAFAACPDAAAGVTVQLDGARERAWAPREALPDVAARLAGAFLALCEAHNHRPHRMRDLVALCGAPAVFRHADLELRPGPDVARAGVAAVGIHRAGPMSFVGATPAFGLLDAAAFAAFVDAAEAAGAPDIRVTPWRGLIAPRLPEAAATHLATFLRETDLILDPDDPRLAVSACVGQPACRRATTPVPADAARLASLGDVGRLHVSGCAKGCADARAAPIALVGRDGRYDLVRDGRADDPPFKTGLLLCDVVTMLPALLEAAP